MYYSVNLANFAYNTGVIGFSASLNTVKPPNNGHIGDEHFVHCSEIVLSLE